MLIGSVKSNRSHFEMALRNVVEINSRFGGKLEEMITHKIRLEDYRQAFAIDDLKHIKTVIEVEPWY